MNDVQQIYDILLKEFKHQGWWPISQKYYPADYSKPKTEKEILEICLGAILTQSTSWKNVEKSLINLQRNDLIDLNNLRIMAVKKLAEIIKSSGYNNQKARKIKEFVKFLESKQEITRENLLGVWGIGPETADSILLYAYKRPYFVIDTYTKRIFSRLGFKETKYEELQELFEKNIEKNYKVYNEFHALLVKLGKDICKTKPLCSTCPLSKTCEFSKNITS